MTTKICIDCREEKLDNQFYTNPKGHQRKSCNSCVTKWNRLSQDERDAIKAARTDAIANRTHKICPKCHQDLPIEAFSINTYHIDQRAPYCRECDSVVSKASKVKGKLPVDQQPKEKECAACNQVLPITQFNKNPTYKDGYYHKCKRCVSEYWHENITPDKRVQYLLTRLKSKAKQLNLPFDLELSDISVPSHCPVLGIQLAFGDTANNRDCTPSVDRIIPELGYVKGNVIIVSYRANRIKNDSSVEELGKIHQFYSALAA